MADINNNDIWIDVETLAKLKNITRRAVRLALNQNKYEYKVENIRGGKTYKIKLSTLEEELQLKYFQEYYDDYKNCDNEVIELSNLNIKQEKLISENQRKIALAKYDLIYAWLDFRKEYKRDKLKANGNIPDKEFLQLYNTGMFQEEIFKILGKVSIGSLYRWRALLDYNKDWTALVGQYKYSTRKEYRTTLALKMIEKWLEFKHSQPCPNAKDKTIQEVLNEIEKQNIDENSLDDLMMAQEIKSIGRNGIRFLKADYFDEALYGIKEKTVIKYSLFDLSYIKVYSMKGEFICKANRITETHPLAYQMGDIKDIEGYKQKIEKQQKLRRKTIKAVREHFNLEDMYYLEKELMQNIRLPQPGPIKEITVQPESKPKKDFEPKVKTSIVARPIFKSSYERYEWHMQNGCVCPEDRTWLANYIKSDEYKEIYGKEQ